MSANNRTLNLEESPACAGSLTAKKTAKTVDRGGRLRTTTDWQCLRPSLYPCRWTVADDRPAVFKTVCGALLRRPGWVRFPSIPATRRGFDSEDDSHSGGRERMSAIQRGRQTVRRVRQAVEHFVAHRCHPCQVGVAQVAEPEDLLLGPEQGEVVVGGSRYRA